MKRFSGRILFLDRPDINTDEIIPAKYLTENTREALKPHLLEDLRLEGFDPRNDIDGCGVIVTRTNFGCGSSREHAPWALETNGINLVLAESFARIFRQNMFNCGMLALELPAAAIDHIFDAYAGRKTFLETDLDGQRMIIKSEGRTENIPFQLSAFDRALIEAGGWVEYADARY
jgi:3-isopropylmalate/(R)-2-methylmalate dehydratase small subunit